LVDVREWFELFVQEVTDQLLIWLEVIQRTYNLYVVIVLLEVVDVEVTVDWHWGWLQKRHTQIVDALL